jgi:hypothetical protein
MAMGFPPTVHRESVPLTAAAIVMLFSVEARSYNSARHMRVPNTLERMACTL